MPIALISEAAGSQSSVYGRFCFALKLEFDFGESVDKPYKEKPVAVRGVNSSLNMHAWVVPEIVSEGSTDSSLLHSDSILESNDRITRTEMSHTSRGRRLRVREKDYTVLTIVH